MSSSSSSRKMSQDEQEVRGEVQQPRWLEDFLETKFFEPCLVHLLPKNELNIYCIDCNVAACKHCVSLGSHQGHKMLQMFRNMYKNVVCPKDMEVYIDSKIISQIQIFKSNKRWVLNCHPNCGSTLDDASSCNIGSRKSIESKSYNYCSISCMFKATSRNSDDSVPPIISIQSPQESMGEVAEPSKRKRKRKGTPHRAPFF